MTAWVVSVRGMSESIIETHNLTKRFAKATTNSVTDLNFAVQQGEMVAFLGPNGAGKTTSIRMLTTLIAPSSGEAIVCGYNTRTQPHKVRAACHNASATNWSVKVPFTGCPRPQPGHVRMI